MTRSETDTSMNLLAEPVARMIYACILAALAVVGIDIAYSLLAGTPMEAPFIGTPVGLEAFWTRYVYPANARLTAQAFNTMLMLAYAVSGFRRARSKVGFPLSRLAQLSLPLPLVMLLAPVHAATGIVIGLVVIFAIDVSRHLAASDRPASTFWARAAILVGVSIAFGLALLIGLFGRLLRG